MKRVLLTGAAGRIGTAFRHLTATRYAFRLVDRPGASLGDPGSHEVVTTDLSDLAACQAVCEGMDWVVHLAADPSPSAGFYESLLDNNIKAAYNILRAAKDQGCQRVVFASSIQTIEGYPLDTQVHPEMPPKPMNLYAATKVFGEAMCHYFAYAEGLPCIAIRVGAYAGNDNYAAHPEKMNSRNLSAYVSERDLTQLIVQSLETPDLPFAVFQAVSDNRFKRMDITSARRLVDYQPQDDAFAIFNVGIHHPARWYNEWDRGKKPESE